MNETRIRLKTDALHARELEGETVAVHEPTSTYLSFNRTATLLWPKLSNGTTRTELVESLTSEFDVERAQAEKDVDAFIASLEREDLLEA